MKDYYYILGVEANCTTDDVKDAYRKLSKKFHPDLNQNDSYFENRFKEIQEAYETLSDPLRRRRYDRQFFSAKSHTINPEPAKQRRYPRTTAIDIIFTIVLIGITILFGRYVITAIGGTAKVAKSIAAPVVTDTPQVVAVAVKHHKKKRHNFIANTDPSEKVAAITKPPSNNNHPAEVISKPPLKVKTDTIKPQSTIPANKVTAPVHEVSNTAGDNIPYNSYLRGNITGVINMHRSDDINSAIVAVIPTHSKVLVLQKGDYYYKVQFNGDEGYVPKWTVLTK